MSQESLQVRAIFIDAVENLSPERWGEYLDEACGDDATLRDKVQRLLDAHGAIGSFMNKPAAAPVATVDQPITEKPGTQIGPYKLLQQIGEGGMGAVYMAEQKEPVERRVALKIIKPGMDTRQVIVRFEVERQALAIMDHPNIAKVLDAGTTDSGRPYFVMELVRGVPITQHCDEKHLTPKERLELFVPVCQAVQHAHQKGIIHRDIKPSNVMVALYDDRPVPKIIDFGVAKATSHRLTEKTMFTQYGQIVGTLEYMSPEQAQLNQMDIDTRSDIYSLGVLLYELLTGETPFDRTRLHSAAFDEMLRIIREEEPSKPSTKVSSSQSLPTIAKNRRMEPAKLGSMIRGELDWIVMKAVDKDRSRRYQTANALAADLERYLDDEPVLACPPSAIYRFGKFARRNKAILTTLILVWLAVAVGAAVAVWQARVAHDANRRTQEALAQKDVEYQRAEANLRHALSAVDQLLAEVGHRDLASAPHMEHVRQLLLKRAQRFFESLLAGQRSDPAVLLQVGTAHYKLGDVHALLGEQAQADQDFSNSVRVLAGLLASEPQNVECRRALCRAQYRQALLWKETGRLQEALSLLEQVRPHQQELVALTANAEDQSDLSQSENMLGIVLSNQGQLREAEQLFRSAVGTAQLLVDRFPDESEHFKSLITCRGNLANCLQDQGLFEQGDLEQQLAFKVIDQALQRISNDPELRSHELVMAYNAAVNARNGPSLMRKHSAFAVQKRVSNLSKNIPMFPITATGSPRFSACGVIWRAVRGASKKPRIA